jgi:hypothetical protein
MAHVLSDRRSKPLMSAMGGKQTLTRPVRVSRRKQRGDCGQKLSASIGFLNYHAVRNALGSPVGRTVACRIDHR